VSRPSSDRSGGSSARYGQSTERCRSGRTGRSRKALLAVPRRIRSSLVTIVFAAFRRALRLHRPGESRPIVARWVPIWVPIAADCRTPDRVGYASRYDCCFINRSWPQNSAFPSLEPSRLWRPKAIERGNVDVVARGASRLACARGDSARLVVKITRLSPPASWTRRYSNRPSEILSARGHSCNSRAARR